MWLGSTHPRSQCVGGMLLAQWCYKHVFNRLLATGGLVAYNHAECVVYTIVWALAQITIFLSHNFLFHS